MEIQKTKQIVFHLGDKEVIKLSTDGFFYEGERVDDVHNVYERFNKWLTQAEVEK